MWRGAFLNAPLDFRQMRMQSHTGCISLEWRTTLSLLRWPRQACDFSKLVLFPHISQEFLLLPSGWNLGCISGRRPLQMVPKEAYYKGIPSQTIFLESGCQPGLRKAKTTMSIAISFRSWLLWYFRLSMLPLQLWIHFSRSVEISHEEGRNKRESSRSVYVLSC